jgi:hypothetical protein
LSIQMKRLSLFLVVCACWLCVQRVAGASDRLSLGGYFKSHLLALDQPEIANSPLARNQPIIGAVNNRLRLNLSGNINHWASFTLAYDFSPRVQDRSLFEAQIVDLGLQGQAYRAVDLDSRLYPQKNDSATSFAIFQNLDRVLLTLKTRLADVHVGRQAIAWGSARVINPTDVLAPYAFNELDAEDRVGVDALRLRAPMGLLGEIDAGYVFGDDFEFKNNAMFLRGKINYRRTDISILAVDFQENLLTGLDIARSIGSAGFWLETAYTFADAMNSDRSGCDQDYFRSSVGLDYSLRDGTYLFAEYHFNQAGDEKPDDYLVGLEKTAYREGSVYLLGKHYFAPGISHQFTPLITFSGQVLINMTDHSIFMTPQVEYNIAEDIYLSAGAYMSLGKNPEVILDQAAGPLLRLRSEFGGYPRFYFTSFRVYF